MRRDDSDATAAVYVRSDRRPDFFTPACTAKKIDTIQPVWQRKKCQAGQLLH